MKIENYSEINEKNVVAEFSVYLEGFGMTIHKFKVLRNGKGGWYFSYPQYSLPNPDDHMKRSWHSYIDLLPERKKEFEKKVNEALKVFVRLS